MSSTRDNRFLSTATRKKSRRHTENQYPRKTIEYEADECKLFPYLLQKNCEEKICSRSHIPDIFTHRVTDDGEVIYLDDPSYLESAHHIFSVSIYSNMEMKVESVVCKSKCDVFDTRLFFALNQTLLQFPSLSTLNLDYCNLTAEQISVLHNNLKIKRTISQLSLIGNPNRDQNYHHLIDCGLKVLVLKFCKIDENGLREMAKEFLELSIKTPSLVHLDLSNNMIFDEGCKYIAAILRCDRTLKSINLTDCKISDVGFKMIAECFSKFSLDSEEICVRRKIRFNYFKLLQKHEDLIEDNSAPSAVHPDTLKDDLAMTEELMKKHPFTNDSFEDGGEIFCKGNYALDHLNIAYNHLTQPSLDLLLKTVMEQTSSVLSTISKGLQRVVLEGNASQNQECDALKTTIQELVSGKRSSIQRSLPGSLKSERVSVKWSMKSSGGSGIKDRAESSVTT